MKVNRQELLDDLKSADIGRVSGGELETLEQCRHYIFKDGNIITFNSEVRYQKPTVLDFDVAIPGGDLEKLLQKMPDEEVDVEKKNNEIVIKGEKRSAGIKYEEVRLPYDQIPEVKSSWNELDPRVPKMLRFAANTCGTDYSQILTTLVHITPELIEATDRFRMFRSSFDTGFLEAFCVRGKTIRDITTYPLTKAAYDQGWLHLECDDDAIISCSCSGEDYLDDLDQVLNVNGHVCELPDNINEILDRAEIMQDNEDVMPIAQISVNDDVLSIKTQKDTGWFKEKKTVDYDGDPLSFKVNPQFLYDLLDYTHEVTVGESRMKIEKDSIEFITALEVE